MNVVCVGGGPGGLFLALLIRRWIPESEVTVYERSARGHAEGWGIVYWDDLLANLQRADPESASRMRAASAPWRGQALVVDGRELRHAGGGAGGGYGLGRSRLLELLAERATSLGVRIEFQTEIADSAEFPQADLIVASDGAGSPRRTAHNDIFRPHVRVGRNRYIWLGVKRKFEAFTFGMVETAAGSVWFHAYSYGDTSTFIAECAPETWERLGFDQMSPGQAAAVLSGLFARELDGHELMVGDSTWRSFRTVRNRTWVNGRTALLGDAAHTAHFAIGSGTQLALEDAISLATALRREPDVPSALQAYSRERRTIVGRIQQDADASAAWFENMPRYRHLPDEMLFDLLLHRRSRLMAHMPPRVFWYLHRASRKSPLVHALRRKAGRLVLGLPH